MKTRNSEVDKTYEINEGRWALALVRKTHGIHQQHAFFVLEGIENGKAATWFMDLVGPGLSVGLPNIKNSKIRTEKFSAETEMNLQDSPLLFRCKKVMMDLKPNDEIACKNWYIDKEDALRLIDSIEKDKPKPPVFNILGKDSALTGSSAFVSSKEKGHNCFTYAKEKIQNLGVSSIKIECDNTAYCIDHIASISSFTLKAPKKPTSYSYCPYFNKTVLVGTGLVATLGMLETARRYYFSP